MTKKKQSEQTPIEEYPEEAGIFYYYIESEPDSLGRQHFYILWRDNQTNKPKGQHFLGNIPDRLAEKAPGYKYEVKRGNIA